MTATHRFSFLFGALGSLLLVAGCPDPEAEFDEFQQRFCASPDNIRPGTPCACSSDIDCGVAGVCEGGTCSDGCRAGSAGCQEGFACSSDNDTVGDCVPSGCIPPTMAGEIDGDYFFALTPAQSPTKPAPMIATVTSTMGNGGIEMTLSMQPINADDRVTPEGGPFTLGPFPIAADGSFDADWGSIVLPGATNPLTASELGATVPSWRGNFCVGSPLICGTLDGDITMPVMLNIDGTTWAMVPMDVHMEPAVINCAGDTAAPI
jgi:hypothetical protein